MSNSANTGAHRLPYYNRTAYLPAAVYSVGVSQQTRPSAWSNVSVELPAGGRPMHNQHPGQAFHVVSVPPSARANVPHLQSLRQTRMQFEAARVDSYPKSGGGPSRCPAPNDFRHNVRHCQPVHQATGYQSRTREPHPFPPPHISTTQQQHVSYGAPVYPYAVQPPQPGIPYGHSHSITPSTTTHNYQSNWPAAAPPQVPTHINSFYASPTALSPSSPASLGSGDISPTTSSPSPTATPSSEASGATEFCPFPGCLRRCGRRQETERHVCQHLPHHIYCMQPGCGWTGNRRYSLRQHFKKAHRGVPFPEHAGFMIYDAKSLAKQLLNQEITVGQAECEARLLFQSKAAQLKKQGIWGE